MNWDMQPAGWVIYKKLSEKKNQIECICLYGGLICILLVADLHFSMHTAVDIGDTPGWARRPISCRGKHCPLVLVESLQGRILAWTL